MRFVQIPLYMSGFRVQRKGLQELMTLFWQKQRGLEAEVTCVLKEEGGGGGEEWLFPFSFSEVSTNRSPLDGCRTSIQLVVGRRKIS